MDVFSLFDFGDFGLATEQALILCILAATVAMFIWGRWRHDMVALGALLACVIAGLVPSAEAFAGFGHPAVITVACVLVLSRGLFNSGAVDALTATVIPKNAGPVVSMTALVGVGALLSGFMNNVGAMALLMPVAVQMAGRFNMTPGQVLMPLAFGTILGGMTTLIGTPPNLIVSGFRADVTGEGFAMFDFTPVGLAVAAAGIVFVVFAARFLVPASRGGEGDEFETGAYFTEARIPEKSKAVGKTLREIENDLEDSDAQIIALIRNEVRISAPSGARKVRAHDILVIEADVDGLAEALSKLGLKLEEQGASSAEGIEEEARAAKAEKRDKDKDSDKDSSDDDDIVLRELVVRAESALAGRSARDMLLRSRYGLNLLAVSRDGRRSRARLRTLKLKSGDLLLMQGPAESLSAFAGENGLVPLAQRSLRIPDKKMAFYATAIMVLAILIVTLGILPAPVAFALGVLASMVLRTVPPRSVYQAIDWPVIVLLGALIPVAGAMEATGTASLIATFMVENIAQGHAIGALVLILITTMFLSDMMNNAATAAVMCPIAIGIAAALNVNPDSFLMAVAIGASCAFLTPIGHQNNTLILGPGGFRFGDYWRLGLPLQILVIAVSVPLLLMVWPL